MKRFCLLCVAVCMATAAIAQNDPIDISSEYNFNEIGDKHIRLSLSWIAPMPSITADGEIVSIADTKQRYGFGGFIGYDYFITQQLYIGGLISFDGIRTIAGNNFFCIPVTFCAGYQFSIKKFEIPLELNIGGALQTYNSRFYFGPVLQPSVGVFYRVNPDWSFGVNASWQFLPQWYTDRSLTRYGNELVVSGGFRYHF